MNTALAHAALPTARAMRWAPAVLLAAVLVAATLLARSAGRPADVVLAIAAAGLAATVVSGLHDPAAAMLTAVPVSLMQRRVLRLGLLGLPALAVWFLLDSLTTARLSGPGPLLAAAACGVAVALWAPQRRAVLLGASTPVALFALHQLLPDGTVSDVVGWWLTEPWWVLAAATLLCVAGRRR
ncbi:hypothetical protein ACFQW6_05715 [Nocardioides sp. GCM10028917]|uniref:hypothetical protein n=1 Tax=Nocardioides sp. GCM10028917 TaxID=3273408 RepID=UPI00361E6869